MKLDKKKKKKKKKNSSSPKFSVDLLGGMSDCAFSSASHEQTQSNRVYSFPTL